VQVRAIQRALGLHMPADPGAYSESYLRFLEKVVALRAFHVPMEDVRELFETEKKILTLLHADSLSNSPTWYLDDCISPEAEATSADRLLLSGHKIAAMGSDQVQQTLDFGERDPELFKGSEMGEDLRWVIAKYLSLENALRQRIVREKPVVENALLWAKGFLRWERKTR
jgi:hypothetical protein